MAEFINGADLDVLKKVHDQIEPMAHMDFLPDDWYIDGEIVVKNAVGYSIGRFVPEDDWWVFKIEHKSIDGTPSE